MKKQNSSSTPFYVTVLFCLCLAALSAAAVTSYRNLEELRQYNSDMEHSLLIQVHLKNINFLITDAEDSLLGYYISGDQAALDPLTPTKDGMEVEFNALEKLVEGNPLQQQRLTRLRNLFGLRMNKFEERATHFRRGGTREVVDIVKRREGTETMDEVRLLEISMEKDELSSLTASRNRFSSEFDHSVYAEYLSGAFAILILVTFYRLIRQHLKKRRSVEDMLTRANEDLEAKVAARTEKLSMLTRHLLNISEIEKAKLARELHDEMGTSLTAISLEISAVIEKLKHTAPDLAEQLKEAKQTLRETVELKRRIIEDLRPSMLETLGLATSIRSHCEKVVRIPGLNYEDDIEEEFDNIDPDWSIALFRIVQESLSNIIKYAKATRVKVSLKRGANGLRLRVMDNGVGIQPDEAEKPKSHGLLGMRERAMLLGGQFSIGQGMEKRGASIDVFLPYRS